MDRHGPRKNVITLNLPGKGSNPRMWKVTTTLIEMVNGLPKQSTKIFSGSLKSMKTTLLKTRKRLAQTIQTPRLLRITFHAFRHWKETMIYHQTKNPYCIKNFLGCKEHKSTEVYINIEHTLFESGANDQFTVKIAQTLQEIKTLL